MINIAEIIYQGIDKNKEYEMITNKVMQKCFEVEKINSTSLYICITLTTPNDIRKINNEYRNIDKETDVLSFPMFEKEELDKLIDDLKNKKDIETVQEVLGDVIISVEKVEEQAKEYGHSFEREFAYMLVHGFYHLMGYDHMVEEDKKIMREKEENILLQLDITR